MATDAKKEVRDAPESRQARARPRALTGSVCLPARQPLSPAARAALDAEHKAEELAGETALILYHLFENPQYFLSWGIKGTPFYLAGEIIAAVINILIIVSTVAFCAETVADYSPDPMRNPETYKEWERIWTTLEVVMVALFTLDWTVRGSGAFFAGHIKTWTRDAMNWIDFLAIFPFYIALVVPGMVDLRFLRVVRLVRILKTIPATREMGGVIKGIVDRSIGALFIPLYFMCLCVQSTLQSHHKPVGARLPASPVIIREPHRVADPVALLPACHPHALGRWLSSRALCFSSRGPTTRSVCLAMARESTPGSHQTRARATGAAPPHGAASAQGRWPLSRWMVWSGRMKCTAPSQMRSGGASSRSRRWDTATDTRGQRRDACSAWLRCSVVSSSWPCR